MEKKTYANNCADWADELNRQGYDWPDEEMEPEYLPNVIWVNVYATRCKCSRFIEVKEVKIEQFYNNTTVYCRWCGRNHWENGIYDYTKIQNENDLLKYIEAGYEISEQNLEILNAMGYEVEDKKLADYAISSYCYCCICKEVIRKTFKNSTGWNAIFEQYCCSAHTEAETNAYCGQDVVGYCNVCGKEFGPNAKPDCGHAD